MIPKADQSHSQCPDLFFASLIFLPRMIVDRTIRIHRQHQFFAVEIHDPLAQRALTVEIIAAELLSFEPLPEQNFRKRHLLPRFVRPRFEVGSVSYDFMTHGDSVEAENPPLTPPRR